MDIVIEKKMEACVKSAKEKGQLFSKRIFKKNTETTEQEQNISFSSK